MLEKLKAEVLLAYQELNRYGLDSCAWGAVSAIDRETGRIVMKSAREAIVVDLQGNVLEGTQTSASDVHSHIALYRAFPQLGGVARPNTTYATIFAQVGMDIPALGSFHKERFQGEIPCAVSAAQMGDVFRDRNMDPRQTPAALVLSHSAYAWGVTALDAVSNAAALEETANMAYHTMQLDHGLRPMQ